jgi:hypothetical protein
MEQQRVAALDEEQEDQYGSQQRNHQPPVVLK